MVSLPFVLEEKRILQREPFRKRPASDTEGTREGKTERTIEGENEKKNGLE